MQTDARHARIEEIYASEQKRLGKLFNVDLSNVPLEIKPARGSWLGQARTLGLGFHKVSINSNYFGQWDGFKHICEDTVTHELVHVISIMKHGRAGSGHGALWKACMVKAGKLPNRLANVQAHNPKAITKPVARMAKCPNCMNTLRFTTKSKWNNRSMYGCPKCGSNLAKAIDITIK